MDKEYLTLNEVSTLIRVHPTTLRKWRMRWPSERQGPPSFKAGGKVLYRRKDVQAWITRSMITEGMS
ncbi:helix-turn-helix domain-containing protein [Stomatohabitans albus]|uniref:helix-turn-helix domain-containing protein n=1 Tax=Stomatohabitans albus TaxID=3110766 RepID=UPI00300D397C